jgi:protein-tyrosine phosphatase
MRILTVCLGNICRSPLAEGIIRQRFAADGIPMEIDSCGTAAYHVGEKADPRSIETAWQHGIDINAHRARRFERDDFDHYDLILAMDLDNLDGILRLARNDQDRAKVQLIMNFVYPGEEVEVPDPYYGGQDGFERVYRMLDAAAEIIVQSYRQ